MKAIFSTLCLLTLLSPIITWAQDKTPTCAGVINTGTTFTTSKKIDFVCIRDSASHAMGWLDTETNRVWFADGQTSSLYLAHATCEHRAQAVPNANDFMTAESHGIRELWSESERKNALYWVNNIPSIDFNAENGTLQLATCGQPQGPNNCHVRCVSPQTE